MVIELAEWGTYGLSDASLSGVDRVGGWKVISEKEVSEWMISQDGGMRSIAEYSELWAVGGYNTAVPPPLVDSHLDTHKSILWPRQQKLLEAANPLLIPLECLRSRSEMTEVPG
jgi:hypothetical protein